jgi:Gpi18-like mannosyltransferase
MLKKIKKFIPILPLALLPTILIWMPFFFRLKSFWKIPLDQNGMATIVANYDGPLFLAVAKTFYDTNLIKQMFSFPLPTEYYPAHFPLFPLLIRIFAPIFGYPYSMLFVTIISSIFALFVFYKLISMYVNKNDALWITAFFSIFPARWLIVRSVGSSEPLFIGLIVSSIFFFKNKKYLLSGIFAGLAQLTKSPAILLLPTYFFITFIPELKRMPNMAFSKWIKSFDFNKLFPLFFIPLSLFAVFMLYRIRLNDFLAYFHSGDNIHLLVPPFQIFNYSASWVGTFWLEEIIFVYLFGILGLINLIKQKDAVLAWFVGIFFVSILFVSHRDLIRYCLPIVPFLFVAFRENIIKKEFKIVAVILLIPIYLFSLAYISQNVMPISDWAPLL